MDNQKLTIIASIKVKEGKLDLVKKELLKLIDITRAEEGCINYDLHQDQNNKNIFLFHENWTNRALWERHINSNHMAEYNKATEGAGEESALHEMTQIG